MKNLLYLSLVLLFLATACKKEAEITVLKDVIFSQPATVSANAVVLNPLLDNSNVLNFSWSKVVFPIDAPVSYALQFDVLLDVNGATPWANAKEILVGNDVLSKSIQGLDLNKMAIELGIPTGETGKILVRVKALMDRTLYSQTMEVNITPYKVFAGYPAVWVPGGYQSWNPAGAATIVSVKSDKLYEGYVYIPVSESYQFKFTAQNAWEPMAYGTGGEGLIKEANYPGDNLTLPSEGYYELSLDLNTNTWKAFKTTWSILGDATPGGWSTDTQLTYNTSTQVWSVTADLNASGSFKFRANNDWKIDFGLDANGKLAYADNPVFGYTANINNITVSTTGNYTITLDLHTPGEYSYQLKKN